MMFKKRIMLGLFLGYGLLSTAAVAATWRWQHPGFRGQNGMLSTSVLTRTSVDWAPNKWKAECSGQDVNGSDPVSTKVLQGVATKPSDFGTEAILCTNSDEANGRGWTVDKFNYVTLNVDRRNDQRGSWQMYGDWAYGSYKGECPDGYAVTGIAQTPVQNVPKVGTVLCSKISVQHPSSCFSVGWSYNSSNDWFGWSVGSYYGDFTFYGQDWNFGRMKMSCPADMYVAGVAISSGAANQLVSHLLCCQ